MVGCQEGRLAHKIPMSLIPKVYFLEKVEKEKRKKERKEYLYSAFILQIVSKHSGMDHTVLPANTLEVATSTKYSNRHLIAAYYSFIDSEGMKG